MTDAFRPYVWRDPVRTRKPPADLIKPGEAADLLGIHTQTLTRWAKTGFVASHRSPGGHRRYSRSDLQSLLQRPGRPCRYRNVAGCQDAAIPFRFECAAHTDIKAEVAS